MPIKTTTVHVCDECDKPIDTGDYAPWVDASVHGVIFHNDCWHKIGGPRVARVLHLDDIVFRGGAVDGERAWGPR